MTRIRREYVVLLFAMTLWKHVAAECSEAHNVACSLPWMHLKTYTNQGLLNSLRGFLPGFNETTIRDLCGYFQTYIDCIQPYLNGCDDEDLQDIINAFTPICTYSKELINHIVCYKKLNMYHTNCHKLHAADIPSSSVHHCLSINMYVSCLYTVTAFGCSPDAAELYFKVVSLLVNVFSKISHYECQIRYPNVKMLTTTTTVTTNRLTATQQNQGITTNRRIPSGDLQQTSSATILSPSDTYSLYMTFVLITWFYK